jgi:hypothetical protein
MARTQLADRGTTLGAPMRALTHALTLLFVASDAVVRVFALIGRGVSRAVTVDVDDAATGSVRLRAAVETADAMTLETRSTSTVPVAVGPT